MPADQDVGYPDIESVLIDYLKPVAPTGEQTPESFDGPFIRVNRVGGFDDGLTDRPRVEIACYSPTRRQSQEMSEQVRQLMLAADGSDAAGVFVDHVITESQAGRTPYANEDIRRIAAIYRLSVRRPRS